MVDICLSGLPSDRVLAYMDDIVIFSRTLAEHESMLEAVFERLRSAGILLKASKCVIGREQVDFLASNVIKAKKGLKEGIDYFEIPEGRKELERFLRLAGF